MRHRLSTPAIAAAALLLFLPTATAAQEEALELSLDSLLSTPVSTASKYEQRQIDAPAFVTIVTAETIERFGYRTLAEVLTNQVGFYIANDREYTDAGMRGFGRPSYYNNKILVLADGHTLNENFTGGARLGSTMSIDLDDIERIEIVRGPGSSLYGARAMLAVVNLVTRKGRDLDDVEAVGTVGSLGTKGASMRVGTVWGATTDLALSGSWGESSGEDLYFPELDVPELNNGRVPGLDWERYARGLATFRRGGLSLQGVVATRSKGIATGAYQTTLNHPDAESRDRKMFFEAKYDRPVGSALELNMRGYADSYEQDSRHPFGDDQGPGREALRAHSSIDVRSLGGETHLRWDPSLKNRLVVGAEVLRVFEAKQEIENADGSLLSASHPYDIFSAFVHDELQLTPNLAVTVGIRRDQYSTQGSATTPRGAVVYHASPGTTFKMLAGGAFRAPNLLELYTNRPSAALLSNPDLEPEKIRTLELLWEQQLGSMAATVSVFHNRVKDLIELVGINTPDSIAGGYGRLAFQQQNIANARSVGLDAEIQAELPYAVLARFGYSFHDSRDEATGSDLINAPRHQLKVSATKDLPANSHIGVSVRSEAGRNTLYGTRTHAATVVDLTLAAHALFDGLTLQALVKNAFDIKYSVPGGYQHVQSAIPQPGRAVTVRAGWHW